MKKAIQILTAGGLLALLMCSAFAQAVGRGTVTGRVTNSTGAAVPKALVTVTSDVAPSFKQTVTCNDTGDFSVPDVPSGPVRASAVNPNGVVRASASANLVGNGGTVAVAIRIPEGK